MFKVLVSLPMSQCVALNLHLVGSYQEIKRGRRLRESPGPKGLRSSQEEPAAHADPAMKDAADNLQGLATLKLVTQRRARASRAAQTSLTSLNRIGTSHINLPSEDFALQNYSGECRTP